MGGRAIGEETGEERVIKFPAGTQVAVVSIYHLDG